CPVAVGQGRGRAAAGRRARGTPAGHAGMKILLLGANGQVGHELLRSLSALGDVLTCTREGRLAGGARALACDLATPGAAAAHVREHAPDLVVNASAYTAVDRA